MEMKKLKRTGVAVCIISTLLACSGMVLHAEGENSADTAVQVELEQPVTAVDADGNVYKVDKEAYTNTYEPDENAEEQIDTYASSPRIVNFNTKGNATTNYTDVATGESGYTNGAYGADAAYLGTQGGQVKFMLSGVIGLVDSSEVQIVNVANASSISYYYCSGGRLYHAITYNVGGTGYPGTLDQGAAPSYLNEGVSYYSYDGHYFYRQEDFGVMLDEYNAGTRSSAVNATSPYINYFQYLPFRSVSAYTSEPLDAIVAHYAADNSILLNTGTSFQDYQNTYGTNALLMLGIAANESSWGTSNIALTNNNLFGLNAVDSSPGESAYYYADARTCIKDFSETYLSRQYLNPENWTYFGGYLGNKASGINVKYASDPYWGEKAASIASAADRLMNNYDLNVYVLGFKDIENSNPVDLDVRAGGDEASELLYTSGLQACQSFIILNESASGGFNRIQSDGVINSDRTGCDSSTGNYNFDTMFAYVSADSISNIQVNKGFLDVRDIDWYKESVDFVSSRKIMTGLNNMLFGAALDVSRPQFATILYRVAGNPTVSESSPFPDVGDGDWYSDAIIWCSKNGIITGYEDGMFGLGDNITREQMAVMMYRYAQFKGFDTSASKDISEFPDAGNVSGFALDGMKWAVGTGLITGDGGNINPMGNASRAVCATIIMRFMNYYM